MMTYRGLQSLGIKLSNIGFGCWQLGGHAWGKVSEEEMVKAIYRAIDGGITLFDTAPIYGLGHSEEVLGKALGARRKDVVIATKVGLGWKKGETFEKYTDSSPANIEREIESSLRRLRTDYIDLYQIHWPDHNTSLENTFRAMEKLKKAGKIRCIGCCNFSLGLLRESLQYGEIESIQIPYSLVDRKVERDILPFCREYGISVLAYSPIARGLLAGNYDEKTKFEADDHRSRDIDEYFGSGRLAINLEIVEKVKVVARKLNMTPAQVALRWVLENPCVISAISGVKNVAQVEQNASVLNVNLPEEDMGFLSG